MANQPVILNVYDMVRLRPCKASFTIGYIYLKVQYLITIFRYLHLSLSMFCCFKFLHYIPLHFADKYCAFTLLLFWNFSCQLLYRLRRITEPTPILIIIINWKGYKWQVLTWNYYFNISILILFPQNFSDFFFFWESQIINNFQNFL